MYVTVSSYHPYTPIFCFPLLKNNVFLALQNREMSEVRRMQPCIHSEHKKMGSVLPVSIPMNDRASPDQFTESYIPIEMESTKIIYRYKATSALVHHQSLIILKREVGSRSSLLPHALSYIFRALHAILIQFVW